MTFFQSIILGIVEGITEFLPISSTAHLQMTASFLSIPQTDFVKSFEIIIQLGAILAVVVLYAGILWNNRELWKRLIVAFIPTGVIGFILYKLIKQYLLGNNMVVVWALILGGIILIGFEYFYNTPQPPLNLRGGEESGDRDQISYKQAFIIGCMQSLAVVPGVSRSAATIITGLGLGINKKAIVEFSFLLAIPTIAAAAGYDILKNGVSFQQSEVALLAVGFVAAFISALFAIKFLLAFIRKRSFVSFGIYRIIIAVIFYFFILYS